MPYGLPGAVKLRNSTWVSTMDGLKQIVVKANSIVQPLYPGADQDGWNGEWCVRVVETGEEVMIAKEELTKNL